MAKRYVADPTQAEQKPTRKRKEKPKPPGSSPMDLLKVIASYGEKGVDLPRGREILAGLVEQRLVGTSDGQRVYDHDAMCWVDGIHCTITEAGYEKINEGRLEPWIKRGERRDDER